MSRSGYSEYDDDNAYLHLGALARAIRGKRGQQALIDLVKALDGLPKKELIVNSFKTGCGMCSLGALADLRGVSMRDLEIEDPLDEVDSRTVGKRLNIATCMAAEIMYENDDISASVTPEHRWLRMRAWAIGKLSAENKVTIGG